MSVTATLVVYFTWMGFSSGETCGQWYRESIFSISVHNLKRLLGLSGREHLSRGFDIVCICRLFGQRSFSCKIAFLGITLMLLGCGPHLLVRFHSNLFAGIELMISSKVHWLLKKRNDISIECLPISTEIIANFCQSHRNVRLSCCAYGFSRWYYTLMVSLH